MALIMIGIINAPRRIDANTIRADDNIIRGGFNIASANKNMVIAAAITLSIYEVAGRIHLSSFLSFDAEVITTIGEI